MSPILASLAMLAGCVVLSNAAAAATLDDVKERGSLRCGTALSIPSRGG
jgi:ABC-type amino acid transport substrate-binding protein